MDDYWSTITKGNALYQMGAQSHRVYLLDRLKELGVKSMLDVGCGTGPLYEMITKTTNGYMTEKPREIEKLRWEFEYKGVDPSPAMIATCKHHFPQGKWQVEHAESLDEKSNAYDALVYMHSFDYIYEYKQALTEAARVSKEWVILLFWQSLYTEERPHALNNSVNGQEQVDWSTARLQHFSLPLLTREAKEAGLRLVEYTHGADINKEGKTNSFLLFEKI